MIHGASDIPGRARTPREQASHWLLVNDQGPLSAAEARDFQAWIADPAHLLAWQEAKAAWDLFDDTAGNSHLQALRKAALALRPEAGRRGLKVALAASLLGVLVSVGAMIWSHQRLADADVHAVAAGVSPRSAATRHATATGERLTVTLPDGSEVTLNTDTEIELDFSDAERLVHLRRGQALFTVAKNPTRPFIVQAADRRVRAVGTVFDVQLTPERLQVVLVEGEVRVEREVMTAPETRATALPAATVLTAGQTLVASLGVAEHVSQADLQRELRWRDGFVEFDDERLGQAVAEMNRYVLEPIVIRDERVASLHISGVFRTAQQDKFLEAVGELLPVLIKRSAGGNAEIVWSDEAAQKL